MIRTLAFLLVYVTVPAVAVGIAFGGWWNLATPVVAFFCIPLADALSSHDQWNPSEADEKGRSWTWLYDVPLYAWIPVQLGLQGWATVESVSRTGWDWFGLMMSVGLFGAVGIVIAHELMHRKAPRERAMAEALMLSFTYPHFCIEHVYGHHKNVGTPLDAASSRFGESLYAYLPRDIFQGLMSAIKIERKRTQRKNIKPWSPRHRLTRYTVLMLAIYGVVLGTLGGWAVAFFAAQGLIAVLLLETINYVEHYGLERKETSPGKYERVRPEHSWDSSHRFSNYWLFNLQRHADHHAHASRPYHLLRTTGEGPQLPHGYPTMLLVSLVPPLWRAIMDPRVEAVRAGQSPEIETHLAQVA